MRALPLCCLALLLCACGQRGDLYLPGAEREAVGSAPATRAADDDDEERAVPAATPLGPANAGAGQ